MDTIGPQILLQVVLIALNAFFAATEIAVISLNAGKLRKMMEEGDKKAGKMLKLVEEPSGFLSTIQIGITLAGFLGSAFAAENFSDPLVSWITQDLGFTAISQNALDTLAVILITIILSYFTLIFGELVPKRIAMQKPMAVAKIACGVIRAIAAVMRPVIWILSASTNGVLRLLHMKVEAEEEAVTEEEIRLMVDLGEEKGTIDASEKELIDNIFEFDNTKVEEVMTRCVDIVAIQKDAQPEEILSIIRASGLSRFPVYGRDINDILGILNTREYLLNQQEDAPQAVVQLLRPAYFVPDSIHTDDLFQDMQKNKLHIAIVIDEYGETSGLVTMEDLLEEIVGNIYDEYDPLEEKEIEQVAENRWRVSGDASIETMEEEIGISFPEEVEFNTLGGLIISQLRTIPADGSILDLQAYGLKIHVDQVRHRRIQRALVEKAGPPEPAEEKDDE